MNLSYRIFYLQKILEKGTYDYDVISDFRSEFLKTEALDSSVCLAKRMYEEMKILPLNELKNLSHKFKNHIQLVNASFYELFRKYHNIQATFDMICPDLAVNFEILSGIFRNDENWQTDLWEFGVELMTELINDEHKNILFSQGEEVGSIRIYQTEYFAYYFDEIEFFGEKDEEEYCEFQEYMKGFIESLLEQTKDSLEFDTDEKIETVSDIDIGLFLDFWTDNVCIDVFFEIEGSFINEETKEVFKESGYEYVYYIPKINKFIVEVSSLWSEYGDFSYEEFFDFVKTLHMAIKKGDKNGFYS